MRPLLAAAVAALTFLAPALAQDAPKGPEAPAPAPAQASALELTAAFDPAECLVGALPNLVVKLTNKGAGPVDVVGAESQGEGKPAKLLEDRAVVSFEVQLDDGKAMPFERIHPSPTAPRTDWPKLSLAAGATAELKVPFPALCAGTWKVTARYQKGAGEKVAAPATLVVKPTAEGSTEVEVVMITDLGPMRFRLFPRQAPSTSLNFARLVMAGGEFGTKRRANYYDGLTFHRVIPGFMIQGGDPAGDGTGGPGYGIPAEFATDKPAKQPAAHGPGRLAMARSGHPESAGCQFYICVGTPSNLDGQYAVFGEVSKGLDVAYTISEVDTVTPPGSSGDEKSRPAQDIHIRTVRIVPGPAPQKPAGQ